MRKIFSVQDLGVVNKCSTSLGMRGFFLQWRRDEKLVGGCFCCFLFCFMYK